MRAGLCQEGGYLKLTDSDHVDIQQLWTPSAFIRAKTISGISECVAIR